MSGKSKITTEQVNKIITEKGYEIDPNFMWKGSAHKVSYLCPKHGKVEQYFNNLKRTNCKKCAIEKASSKRFETSAVHDKLLGLLETRGLKLLKHPEKIFSNSVVEVQCKLDDYTWKTTYNRLSFHKKGCKRCAGLETSSFEKVKLELEDLGYKVLSEAPPRFNNTAKIEVLCPKGHRTESNHSKLKKGYGCKYCAKKAISPEDFTSRLSSIGLKSLDDYESTSKELRLVCDKGHTFNKSYFSVWLDKTKCPKCYTPYSSKGENELAEWLKTLFSEDDIDRNNRKVLSGNEIDILISSKKVGIEYSGLYFHNEVALLSRGYSSKEAISYHQSKFVRALNAGVQLVTIWDYEWEENPLSVKSRLKSLLGKNEIHYGARETQAKIITDRKSKEIKGFLNSYHLQGFAPYTHAFCLYKGEELLSVMTFGKPHRQNMGKDTLILNRYCVKYDHSIQGGASKLFKLALKNLPASKIISYSDNRWSLGGVYKNLGFKQIHASRPDYFYVSSNRRASKQSLKKTKDESLGTKTERELRLEQGYVRVWDCGKLTWLYEK